MYSKYSGSGLCAIIFLDKQDSRRIYFILYIHVSPTVRIYDFHS